VNIGKLIPAVALAFTVAAAVAIVPTAHAEGEYMLVDGWFQGRAVEYYDFGANTPLAGDTGVASAPIFVFIHGMNADGSPDFVEGQHNVVDVVPGEPGYSDLWLVTLVTVPEDYVPDSITSLQEIEDAGYETTATDIFVNCPIVPEGSTLEGGKQLVQGWHDGEEVYYPDFGANPPAVAPIWVLIHGMNADGTPDFVEGQHNIIDTMPGDTDYTAFWRVNLVTVPGDYEANSLRSAADVLSAGYEINQTDMVVNCPVVTVAAAPAPPTTGTGLQSEGSGSSTFYIVIGALIALGAGLAFARLRS
jgi:hypothetical protein